MAEQGLEARIKRLEDIEEIKKLMWGQGRYDMRFRQVGGEWRISFFGFLWNFNTPFDEGWVKTPMALL